MAVNEPLNGLSTTASTNTPAGTDSVGTDLDDHLRDIKKNLAYSARWPVQAAKTTTYTHLVTDLHQWVTADTSGGAFSIDLLAAATAGDGFCFGVKLLVAGNTLTIDGNASETIDGVTTYTMDSQYEAVILVCDGSNWHIATGGPVEGDNVDITNTTAETAIADADEVLVYDATATANRKVTVANLSLGMDCVLLGTASASADEYVTFASIFDDAVYEHYRITFTHVAPTTNGTYLLFELGTGATPTWIQTGYSNSRSGSVGSDAVLGSDNGALGIVSPAQLGDQAGETLDGELCIAGTDAGASRNIYTFSNAWGVQSTPSIYQTSAVNACTTSAAVTSIRFTAGTFIGHAAQTIASGEFRVYGLRNA